MEHENATDARNGPSPVRVLFLALIRMRGADVPALAAETAYYAILAIAPFLIFLIAGIAIISQFIPIGLLDDLETTVQRIAPGETGELLLPLFEESVEPVDTGSTSLGMIGSIVIATWSGSRAAGALLKGAARIRRRDVSRPPLWDRILALTLSVVIGLLVLLSLAVFLFGGAVGSAVAGWIGLGNTFEVIWSVVSWPLMAGIVLLALSVFYWFAAGGDLTNLRFISSGAIVATILWVVIMIGVRIYLLIIDPGSIYGVLGSVIVLVVLLYVMSLALLFGAAVNAEVQGDQQAGQSES